MHKMPVLFVGHGSPMNAIEDNEFTRNWVEIAAKIPKPEAILAVSAHWTTHGIKVGDSPEPRTIYDMYGFPKELYKVTYQPAGSPEFAHLTMDLVKTIEIDNSWGIDHGTWSVLNLMYPKADIPVFQLSVNQGVTRQYHYDVGQALKSLREKGVLILGSGNVVHNLGRVNWGMDGGYDWATEFDGYIKEKIISREYQDVIDYSKAGKSSQLAFHSTEHFDPLLYVLGASDDQDKLSIYNGACVLGSLSMTSYLIEST
jgi:4,5-DOPA dioxygenase extradiol